MKKLALTIAIVLGIAATSFAQDEAFGGGGLFQRGETPQYNYLSLDRKSVV